MLSDFYSFVKRASFTCKFTEKKDIKWINMYLKSSCPTALKKSMKRSWVISVSPRSTTSSGLPRIVPPWQKKEIVSISRK